MIIKNNISLIILLIISVIILYIIIYNIFTSDLVIENKKYNLEKHGVCIFKNTISDKEIDRLKNDCEQNNYKEAKTQLINNKELNELIHKILGHDYQFQDYIWIIKKSSVHTCHRDNNGDFFNQGQQYPSYTMLVYLENMEKCLGIIPGSHKNINSYNMNLTNKVENLLCNKGDVIIFNANLIHVGTIHSNNNNNNLRIQMKITNKNDIHILSYYEDFNKVLNKENTLPKNILQFQKNISCMFPYISNLSQSENITSAIGSDNGAKVGLFQKMFSLLFYGNSNFYDLPNAF
jgi:hypothetical protein